MMTLELQITGLTNRDTSDAQRTSIAKDLAWAFRRPAQGWHTKADGDTLHIVNAGDNDNLFSHGLDDDGETDPCKPVINWYAQSIDAPTVSLNGRVTFTTIKDGFDPEALNIVEEN